MRVTPPSGTVTLLFTDIEGSTQLLRDLGDSYAETLAEHRRLLREAFERNNGFEDGTQGDAFFVTFARAGDAVAAAAEAQHALSAGRVRVRMGIHTGEPRSTDEGYVGMDVHRAARICAAGHGGQVLLSRTTRALVESECLDLGEHRLKSLTDPERLFQLVIPGLPVDFPPLLTVANTNLPSRTAPLIGREAEVKAASDLLAQEEARIVTLTGTGGSGKSRLALAIAAERRHAFPDGVFLVELAALAKPSLVVPAIAETLGVREHVGSPLAGAVAGFLRGKRMLLVLDNFEHVVDAGAEIGGLLRAAPEVSVLVTSRMALRIEGEHELAVLPLPSKDAVALFRDRARSIRPELVLDGTDVRTICDRLDGLPLAIELAAGLVRVLPPRTLIERLERRLPLLTGGRRDLPDRQRTLRATIEWSHDLLASEQQAVFARLGVFAGTWSLDAAEQICDAELVALMALAERNLISMQSESPLEPRFSMLQTIQEYALERLDERGEVGRLRRRHADYFAALGARAEPKLRDRSQLEWLSRLEQDQPNLLAAATWSLNHELPEIPLRLAADLWQFWETRASLREMRGLVDQALSTSRGVPATLRARALFAAARMGFRRGEYDQSRALLEESHALFAEEGDQAGAALALAGLGYAAALGSDGVPAVALCREALALARATGERWIVADALNNLGCALVYRPAPNARPYDSDTLAAARDAHEEALALRREIGDLEGVGASLNNLAWIAIRSGDVERAEPLARETVTLAEARGDQWAIVLAHSLLATVALGRGEVARAAVLAQKALRLCVELGYRDRTLQALMLLAGIAAARGDATRAARLLGAAHAGYETTGGRVPQPEREPFFAPLLVRARAELGDAAWHVSFAAGQAMTWDAAVTYALEDLSEPAVDSGASLPVR
jgi:predicted ATPase/class 3 adenylate cyclase